MSFTAVVPCPNCCQPDTGICSIQCSTRGGTATLCGFPEFANASIPPKRYRSVSFSGGTHGVVYDIGDPACTGGTLGFFQVNYSGAAIISQLTCALTSSGVKTTSENGGSPVVASLPGPQDFGNGTSCFGTTNRTSTNETNISSGACCQASTFTNQVHTGTVTQNLSLEDTEEDAFARLFAGSTDDGWSGYAPSPSCGAAYSQRSGSSISFTKFDARYKLSVSHLRPFGGYTATVSLFRAPYGTVDYTLFETHEIDIVADEFGFYNSPDAIDVPNDIGFVTYATGCIITTPF